mgnify:CR=1 FL=1
MLNCLFFRIFSSVSFVSLYQTKAQRSGFCLELRSKGAERGMPSPAGRYTRSGLCDEVVGMGFCPIFGIWQDAGTPATSQMRCWLLRRHKLHILRFRAKRESSSISLRLLSKSQSLCWIAILFFARRCNVGFCCAVAYTLAACLENRTQRRHAPHGALRVLDTPAGSIGTIFSVVGRSAPTALFRQMRRSPLLFRNDTKIPVCLRVSTLFRI